MSTEIKKKLQVIRLFLKELNIRVHDDEHSEQATKIQNIQKKTVQLPGT